MSGHQPAPDEENHQDYHGGVLVKARARKQGSDAELEHEELQGKRVRERLPAHELQNVQHGPQEEEDHRETVEAAPESLVVVEDPEKEERKRRHGKEVKQQIIGYPGKVEADEVAEETQEHAETPIYNAPKAVYKGYSLFNFYKLTLFVGFGGLNAFWRRILPRKTPSNGSLRDFNVFWREKSSDRVVKGLPSPARSRATATTSRLLPKGACPKPLPGLWRFQARPGKGSGGGASRIGGHSARAPVNAGPGTRPRPWAASGTRCRAGTRNQSS